MPESVPVRCPACRSERVYTAPSYPCACGAPITPPLDRRSAPAPVAHRTWDEEWITLRCPSCARLTQWPRPELGCVCGTVLRVPVQGGAVDAGAPAERRQPPASTEEQPRLPGGASTPARKTPGLPWETPAAAGEKHTPTSEAPTPTDARPGPPGGARAEPTPADPPPTPACKNHAPTEEAPTPLRDKPAPPRQAAPPREEPTPPGQAPTPPRGKPAPADETPTPAGKNPPPPGEAPTPPRDEPAPPRQATPPREEPTPPGQAPTPPRAEPAPAREEPTPAGEEPGPAPPRRTFPAIPVRTARDAVTATVVYLRRLGHRDIRRADQRPTSGIGLAARGLLVQVDPSRWPAAPRDVECLWLTSMTESACCVYFSLAGYTDEARARAAPLGVPLFVLGPTGTPVPVNDHAAAFGRGPG